MQCQHHKTRSCILLQPTKRSSPYVNGILQGLRNSFSCRLERRWRFLCTLDICETPRVHGARWLSVLLLDKGNCTLPVVRLCMNRYCWDHYQPPDTWISSQFLFNFFLFSDDKKKEKHRTAVRHYFSMLTFNVGCTLLKLKVPQRRWDCSSLSLTVIDLQSDRDVILFHLQN